MFASTDAVAVTMSGFRGGTFRGFVRTGGGAVADVCPTSKNLGGRGLLGVPNTLYCRYISSFRTAVSK